MFSGTPCIYMNTWKHTFVCKQILFMSSRSHNVIKPPSPSLPPFTPPTPPSPWFKTRNALPFIPNYCWHFSWTKFAKKGVWVKGIKGKLGWNFSQMKMFEYLKVWFHGLNWKLEWKVCKDMVEIMSQNKRCNGNVFMKILNKVKRIGWKGFNVFERKIWTERFQKSLDGKVLIKRFE